MKKRLCLSLTLMAALPLFAAQDVLTIGSISATPGSSITVPVHLRDVAGTALGGDSGAGNRIQGVMLQVTATPMLPGLTIDFQRAGTLSTPTPLYQRAGSARWLGSYSEASQPLAFNTGAAAPGDQIGTLHVTLPATLTGAPRVILTFNPVTTILSNEAGTVTESVANRHLRLVNGTITLSDALTPPAGVVATATSATSVAVSWLSSAGATQYEVLRKSAGGTYETVGTVPGTSFNDTTAEHAQTHVYVVRALTSNVSSDDSTPDYATTVPFSDDPLVAGTTRIQLDHLMQLRTAVNAFRAAANLSPVVFDASPSPVKRVDLEALRTGLLQARTALGFSAPTFTDAVPTAIKAVHFQELRTAVQ